MNCYAIVNNGNQSLKGLGDKIIVSLSRQKIFAKYRVFGRIIVLECEQELSDAILNNKPHRASAEHAAHVIEVMEAIDTSIKTKETVEVHSNFIQPQLMDWAS